MLCTFCDGRLVCGPGTVHRAARLDPSSGRILPGVTGDRLGGEEGDALGLPAMAKGEQLCASHDEVPAELKPPRAAAAAAAAATAATTATADAIKRPCIQGAGLAASEQV